MITKCLTRSRNQKTRQSIYEFALSRIDTLEDEQFSWPHLRQNLERLFGSIQPLPDFAFWVYDVLMWTQPLKTAFVLGVYLVALFTGQLMVTAGVVVAITLVFYGVTQERVLAGMGLRCLYIDAQRQPAFADKSRTQHIERRTNESSLATLANPDTSPLYASNLPAVVGEALTGDSGANKKKGATETWAEIKDKVLPVLQLQTRDTADLAEKCYNMITWKRPRATLMSIVQSGMLVLVLHCVPSMVLHRMLGLLIALNIFVLVPLQLKFPRYRRMFSLNHVLMWPFPTHAEWAIEQLAKATQPQVTMVEYPTDPTDLSGLDPARTGSSSTSNQPETMAGQPTVTTTTAARVDHFPCTHNGQSGTLVIRSGGHNLQFVSSTSSSASRAHRNVLSVPMADIVRIRKAMDRALWVINNYQLEVNLRSGQVLVFEHVQRRDEAFGLLAAASSDPRRLWRVPGT
ncbi:hypothetical protein BCR44DRAFT_1206780 [Catenaria anguillulae PL171]|uniref:Uncharacterized protein n=1 Tax=Catenaria anguillulae PL171 TaxID=765915 RepID=A0A1Y2H0L6_9FUNG|nr:hypothetical protein BCR44DRAFT_1206780 [Catenaria anguillulae PL171]